VELPTSIGAVTQHFSNLPEAISPELKGATVEELAQRYVDRLSALVAAAKSYFSELQTLPGPRQIPPYLRRIK
jgi:hypothetical protein